LSEQCRNDIADTWVRIEANRATGSSIWRIELLAHPMDTFWKVLDFVRLHVSTVALIVTWITIGLVWWRRRANWLRKEFLSQVNFSLNYVVNHGLAIRTLIETTADKVLLNDWGAGMLTRAATRTSEGDPFIRIADPKDRDFIGRAVLNALSERFANAYLAEALSVPVKTGRFCFAITCEKFKDIRTLKIRVLLIEEAVLQRFAPDGDGKSLGLAESKFGDRIKTLEAMYKQSKSDQSVVWHVQLGVIP
jgi:hypothetical protein